MKKRKRNRPSAGAQAKAYATLALMALLFAGGCSRANKANPQQAAPAPLEITTTAVVEELVDRTAEVVGAIFADEEVQVSNDASGYLKTVHVDFGDSVRTGQVLAELDKRDFQLRVEQARAALLQARARIGADANSNVKPENAAMVRQARAALEDARSRYASAEQLIKTGDIPQQRFVELEQNYRAREAAYQSALQEARAQLAGIEGAQAQLELAQKQLNDTTIRAPFAGTISAKLVSPGQYVREKTPILTLVKDETLRLRARVPEAGATVARRGMHLTFTVDAYPGRSFSATVTDIGATVDPQSRTLTVEAKVPNPGRLLKPGLFARASVVVQKEVPAVMIPKAALYEFAGINKVFVIRGGKALERKVQMGVARDGQIEVLGSDLKPGEKVATSRLADLMDGQEVKM